MGYSANIEKPVGKNGSVMTDYQYDRNTHTDSQFLQESLPAMKRPMHWQVLNLMKMARVC
ncbi:MAG: hypothetical protein HFI55_12290 [Lachnospiraceae bacterium]|jgi:hypothetical protein|nr:hypothetical protein [Lachnospiraceae bacterium]